jgi:replicative DNA helicase
LAKLYENIVSQKIAVDTSYDRLSSNIKRDWGLYGQDMGLHTLNMAIGGLIPRRLTTIGARSGVGKTAVVAQMFDAGARLVNGRRCEFLFNTWELDPSLIIDRMICNKAGVTLRMLNQGAKLLDRMTLERINSVYAAAEGLPVYYQTVSTDIDTVRKLSYEFVKRCKEKSAVEGVEVLPVGVIDYLNMAMFDGSGLRTYGIGDFMNGLKQLCNVTGMAWVVLAQLNRSVDKEARIPDRADFADSSAIENASDNLIVLHRPEYHGIGSIRNPNTNEDEDSRGKMLVRILKCRDYGPGDVLMNCDVKHFRFWAEEHHYNTPYWDEYNSKEFWIDKFGLVSKNVQQESMFT